MSKIIKLKEFNFVENDRVRVKKTSIFYGKHKFYPADTEGIVFNIQLNADIESDSAPLYILWDNDQLAATRLQDIELVENDKTILSSQGYSAYL